MVCEMGAAVLLVSASRICARQYTASLSSYHLDFFQNILFESKWCNNTIVLTWKKNVIFYQRDQISTVNQSIAVYTYTEFSFKRLRKRLLRYMNVFTNFISGEDGTILIKTLELCFICVHEETNASCCLLQAMQQKYSLSKCICKKY